jgi:hypothetical protein
VSLDFSTASDRGSVAHLHGQLPVPLHGGSPDFKQRLRYAALRCTVGRARVRWDYLGLRARHRQRIFLDGDQSDLFAGAVSGSARSDNPLMDGRRPVSFRRQTLSRALCERMAAPAPEAASANLDPGLRQPRRTRQSTARRVSGGIRLCTIPSCVSVCIA